MDEYIPVDATEQLQWFSVGIDILVISLNILSRHVQLVKFYENNIWQRSFELQAQLI